MGSRERNEKAQVSIVRGAIGLLGLEATGTIFTGESKLRVGKGVDTRNSPGPYVIHTPFEVGQGWAGAAPSCTCCKSVLTEMKTDPER